MADATISGELTFDAGSLRDVSRRLERVGATVRNHLFAPGVAAACERIVEEATRRDRPLAWEDVTGNLRASLRFQVEAYVGANPFGAIDGSGEVYNAVAFRSGRRPGSGEHGVVFAPPDYAVHVEAKSTRSVLMEPVATLRDALFGEVAAAARREWEAFVFHKASTGAHVG